MAEKKHRSAPALERAVDSLLEMSYGFFSLAWLLATLLFAVAYWALASYVPGQGPPALELMDPMRRFLNALYFSVITATSTGYGDILPVGFSKLLAALQSIVSVVIVALFISKFASQRENISFEHIHQLSFDSAFHNVRQGLFVARKDLDLIIKKIERGAKGLDRKDWLNLKTAFQQMQIFIRRIPDFYEMRHRTYVIEADRELLLLDSVERTLGRAAETLTMLKEADIRYLAEEACMRELHGVLTLVGDIFPSTRDERFRVENTEALQEVLARADEIRTLIEHV